MPTFCHTVDMLSDVGNYELTIITRFSVAWGNLKSSYPFSHSLGTRSNFFVARVWYALRHGGDTCSTKPHYETPSSELLTMFGTEDIISVLYTWVLAGLFTSNELRQASGLFRSSAFLVREIEVDQETPDRTVLEGDVRECGFDHINLLDRDSWKELVRATPLLPTPVTWKTSNIIIKVPEVDLSTTCLRDKS